MKTKNNVQKAILNTFAAIASIVLISFTVSAQSFWKTVFENNSLNEIAMVMVDSKSESAVTLEASSSNDVDYANLLITESEESLELEDWMTDNSYFNATTFNLEEETEESLELENWMIEDSYFETESVNFEIELEDSLELEEWMLNENHFDNNNIQEEKEQALELESWMVSSEFWVG